MYGLWDSNWGAPGKNKQGAPEEGRETLLGRTSRMSLVRARQVLHTAPGGTAMSVVLVV